MEESSVGVFHVFKIVPMVPNRAKQPILSETHLEPSQKFMMEFFLEAVIYNG